MCFHTRKTKHRRAWQNAHQMHAITRFKGITETFSIYKVWIWSVALFRNDLFELSHIDLTLIIIMTHSNTLMILCRQFLTASVGLNKILLSKHGLVH